MSRIFYIFISISLCFAANNNNTLVNIEARSKKSILFKSAPPYPTSPNPILYFAEKKINQSNLNLNLKQLSSVTCLTFKKQATRVGKIGINFLIGSNNTVSLTSDKKKPTLISLSLDTYKDDKLFFYYLGIALGLSPESSRHDRDEYIEIVWENIDESYKQYYKLSNNGNKKNFNTGFDYSSVMLLDRFYGSKNRKPVYNSKLSEFYHRMINLNSFFTHNEAKLINSLYCNKNCELKKIICRNGGYLNKDCKCKCPDGYAGNTCSNPVDTKNKCGGKAAIVPSKTVETISSRLPGTCFYFFYPKPNTQIKLTVDYLRMSSDENCLLKSGLEIKYRNDKGATGFYLCGKYKNITISPIVSRVGIRYHAKSNNSEFKISYNQVKVKNIKEVKTRIF
uniref:Metalloendopeptidase n=1 Tax=Strongyloides venezuelensis TaxID=75913 RepID=A0A0K0FTP6_STRVS